MSRLPRRAGTPWRILVHSMEPGGGSGDSWNVASDSRFGGGDGKDSSVQGRARVYHRRHIELPGTDFDELVISRWLHLEQQGVGVWWLAVGGVVLILHADRDGRPRRVSVYGPGSYDDPVDGVQYDLEWGPE